jgi:NAD(P)H-flavin reductase
VEQIANNLIAISQIYVCGPPAMVGKLVEAFQDNKIPSFRYSIL